MIRSAGKGTTGAAPTLTTIADANQVQLIWDHVPHALEYEVLRNEERLDVTNGNVYIDASVQPGGQYEYKVQALTPEKTPLNKRWPWTGITAQKIGPDIPASPPGDKSNTGPDGRPLPEDVDPGLVDSGRVIVMNAPVAVPTNNSTEQLETVLKQRQEAINAATDSTVRHQAFIPDAKALAWPCTWSPNTYFGGDNRGFDATSSRNRTQLDAFIDWTRREVRQIKYTGDTRVYSNDGVLQESRNAGTDGMNIYWVPAETTDFQAVIRAEHSVGNPFCTAGAITYDWQGVVYRDGVYTLEGSRYPVPNHGLYVATGLTGWRIGAELLNSGYECITGICGWDNIRARGNGV
ncbi:hypothetical protein [Saccharopolyspora antimicrobica]|uniref:hypothetical protein n=1 Tax=Saccharopolyspora antimicrobica TaxID=455193 RepID=UPI001160AF53|nr:hypothetical protein [Saccharopolyspora antimicrobica]